MVRTIFFGIAVSFSVTAMAANPNERSDFKCYLDTTIGPKIMLFDWKKSEKAKEMNRLVAKRLEEPNSNQAFHVKKVIECRVDSKSFRNAKAFAIDDRIVR
ncbi:TapY2 family type IVa secretion system protein [Shewanella gelidii]|uniref:Uncharacterized protein n=1 Tax=Shewanella gelidii TaxID=1642821 RepID=A0A917JJ07_9GAMM|nr:TapY2 family type IVa secretion system protein [Shewanella gelidii]MCL1097038.1 TapY2 family type IVa secretion system protein [Shewanella gelidii]GGI72070.1 hypothetical protein GCM10009332_06850 [Shewanella gelidii]